MRPSYALHQPGGATRQQTHESALPWCPPPHKRQAPHLPEPNRLRCSAMLGAAPTCSNGHEQGVLLAPTPAHAIHAIVNETNPLVAARMAQTPQPMRRKRPDLRTARAQAADARSRRSTRKDHHVRTAHRNRPPPPRQDGSHADDRERPAFHPVSHRRLRGTGRAFPGACDCRGESARSLLEPPVHSTKIASLRSVFLRRCGQPASRGCKDAARGGGLRRRQEPRRPLPRAADGGACGEVLRLRVTRRRWCARHQKQRGAEAHARGIGNKRPGHGTFSRTRARGCDRAGNR